LIWVGWTANWLDNSAIVFVSFKASMATLALKAGW